MDFNERNQLLRMYFDIGLSYKDIAVTLAQRHRIILSVRHIKRLLQTMRLGRRRYSGLDQVITFIQSQLKESGRLLGYRMMHTKCIENGLNVKVEDVRLILLELDETAMTLRRCRRLVRRNYFAKGPNFVWHVDGYDKLKPYGLCINGCIDGFSRKLIWLNVYNTNNNPAVIGSYFLEAVTEMHGCPSIVRCDRGTENVTIRVCQKYLRRNDTDTLVGKCFLYGKSTSNQRIEGWWSYLRKACMQYWIDLFTSLIVEGSFDGGSLDKCLVQFCFTSLVQNELDDVLSVWNQHLIRPSSNENVPSGRPNAMYLVPELWGVDDYLHLVSMNDIAHCKQEVVVRSNIPCDRDVYDVCIQIMVAENLAIPDNCNQAIRLYQHLRRTITRILFDIE